jgi:hypothetical protein
LFIARNVARSLRRSSIWDQVEKLTEIYQPLPQLAEIVALSKVTRCVALLGNAGVGKSSMTAAMLRHEVTENLVPEGFVQAVVFVSDIATSGSVARDLQEQLVQSVQGFLEEVEKFAASLTADEKAKLDQLHILVLGPLSNLSATIPIRIIVDGLDRLPTGASEAVQSALDQLARGPEFEHVRLIVTSRPDTSLPFGARKLNIGLADSEQVVRYLKRRNIPTQWHQAVIDRGSGNWLVIRLHADLIVSEEVEDGELPNNLTELYDLELRRIGATDVQKWRNTIRPVLCVLAGAGAGPVLPITLLCNAVGRLGGPGGVSRIRDVLVDTRGLIVRSSPGTDQEQIGLFHQTFGEHLSNPTVEFSVDINEAHEAILRAISELAPVDSPPEKRERPEYRYAAAAEPSHLWQLGRYSDVLVSLERRQSHIPSENLACWRSWQTQYESTLGRDHPATLTTRTILLCGRARTVTDARR